ncbi:hypothetical protein KVT40_000113 [Elsinoe batatas]|uniref:Uncharacterized protein n=1 Tax=Elsinoe batatas TaxID=2601811 RepID=A0A8K0PKU4_9PEZI|nr:hypothetical protein KVT40_000113 [Elsinoe batatas]
MDIPTINVPPNSGAFTTVSTPAMTSLTNPLLLAILLTIHLATSWATLTFPLAIIIKAYANQLRLLRTAQANFEIFLLFTLTGFIFCPSYPLVVIGTLALAVQGISTTCRYGNMPPYRRRLMRTRQHRSGLSIKEMVAEDVEIMHEAPQIIEEVQQEKEDLGPDWAKNRVDNYMKTQPLLLFNSKRDKSFEREKAEAEISAAKEEAERIQREQEEAAANESAQVIAEQEAKDQRRTDEQQRILMKQFRERLGAAEKTTADIAPEAKGPTSPIVDLPAENVEVPAATPVEEKGTTSAVTDLTNEPDTTSVVTQDHIVDSPVAIPAAPQQEDTTTLVTTEVIEAAQVTADPPQREEITTSPSASQQPLEIPVPTSAVREEQGTTSSPSDDDVEVVSEQPAQEEPQSVHPKLDEDMGEAPALDEATDMADAPAADFAQQPATVEPQDEDMAEAPAEANNGAGVFDQGLPQEVQFQAPFQAAQQVPSFDAPQQAQDLTMEDAAELPQQQIPITFTQPIQQLPQDMPAQSGLQDPMQDGMPLPEQHFQGMGLQQFQQQPQQVPQQVPQPFMPIPEQGTAFTSAPSVQQPYHQQQNLFGSTAPMHFSFGGAAAIDFGQSGLASSNYTRRSSNNPLTRNSTRGLNTSKKITFAEIKARDAAAEKRKAEEAEAKERRSAQSQEAFQKLAVPKSMGMDVDTPEGSAAAASKPATTTFNQRRQAQFDAPPPKREDFMTPEALRKEKVAKENLKKQQEENQKRLEKEQEDNKKADAAGQAQTDGEKARGTDEPEGDAMEEDKRDPGAPFHSDKAMLGLKNRERATTPPAFDPAQHDENEQMRQLKELDDGLFGGSSQYNNANAQDQSSSDQNGEPDNNQEFGQLDDKQKKNDQQTSSSSTIPSNNLGQEGTGDQEAGTLSDKAAGKRPVTGGLRLPGLGGQATPSGDQKMEDEESDADDDEAHQGASVPAQVPQDTNNDFEPLKPKGFKPHGTSWGFKISSTPQAPVDPSSLRQLKAYVNGTSPNIADTQGQHKSVLNLDDKVNPHITTPSSQTVGSSSQTNTQGSFAFGNPSQGPFAFGNSSSTATPYFDTPLFDNQNSSQSNNNNGFTYPSPPKQQFNSNDFNPGPMPRHKRLPKPRLHRYDDIVSFDPDENDSATGESGRMAQAGKHHQQQGEIRQVLRRMIQQDLARGYLDHDMAALRSDHVFDPEAPTLRDGTPATGLNWEAFQAESGWLYCGPEGEFSGPYGNGTWFKDPTTEYIPAPGKPQEERGDLHEEQTEQSQGTAQAQPQDQEMDSVEGTTQPFPQTNEQANPQPDITSNTEVSAQTRPHSNAFTLAHPTTPDDPVEAARRIAQGMARPTTRGAPIETPRAEEGEDDQVNPDGDDGSEGDDEESSDDEEDAEGEEEEGEWEAVDGIWVPRPQFAPANVEVREDEREDLGMLDP